MTTNKLKLTWSLLLAVLLLGKGFSSTIIPFHNLGETTDASTLVVLATAGAKTEVQESGVTHFQTPLTVQFVVKGDVNIGSDLFLKHWSAKGEGWVREVVDDVQLTPNETYLLFLAYSGDGGLRPMLVSYGIFQQHLSSSGQYFLVPIMDSPGLTILSPSDGLPIEPLAVYRQDDLLEQLYEFAHRNVQWDGNKSLETLDVAAFLGTTGERAAPAHCSFFNLRWTDFPGTPLPVLYSSAGDPSCGTPTLANTYTVAAANMMQVSYAGINLIDGGTYSGFTPDCTGGTAAAGNFLTSFGPRTLVVIYDDPCEEIPDLMGCAGTLGMGGLYGTSPTYDFDGVTYYQGQHGYVIVNNGVCCVDPTNYALFMAHEMTHALGVGHIPASAGPANMNPTCCIPITALDIACLDYFYPVALPVELTEFRGKVVTDAIRLDWSTASERNHQQFEVERSFNGHDFEPIATILGTGTDSDSPQSYSSVDRQPLDGMNYYRLRQTDMDGSFQNSHTIVVQYGRGSQYFEAVPNPVSDARLRLLIENNEPSQGEIHLINLQGVTLLKQQIEVGEGRTDMEIQLPALPPGHYLLKLVMNGSIRMARFVKH